jgi:hypothetical protein
MSENKIPYAGPDGDFYMEDDEMKLWDNTLMDGLNDWQETTKETKMKEVIDKIRNYYNTCCDIDGRPPYKVDFNEFIDSLENNL